MQNLFEQEILIEETYGAEENCSYVLDDESYGYATEVESCGYMLENENCSYATEDENCGYMLENENEKTGDLTPVGEILAGFNFLGESPEDNSLLRENFGTINLTEPPEKTFSANVSQKNSEHSNEAADYMKDGVLHCGVCHKPKYVLHTLLGKERAFPIECDCMAAERKQEAEKRRKEEKLQKAEECRRHALPYEHMHSWDFAHDDGGSPKISFHVKQYALHFAEMKQRGEGLFLFGVSGTGKTYAAAQIVNALCDEGYRCLVTSFLDIINDLLSLNREKRQEYINAICRHDLVVFDNYGAEPSTYFSDMNVLEIVNICYERHVPMIVTTTLPPETLEQEKNVTRKSALTRLKDRCYCLTLANVKRKKQLEKERDARFRKLLGIEEKEKTS